MARIIAEQTMTLAGVKYERGESVPAEALAKLPQGRLKQMLDLRRVTEDKTRVGRPPKEG